MRDLKFPDPEKEAIVRNHISDIYSFDIGLLPAIYKREQYLNNAPLDLLDLISLGGLKYDSFGNKLCDYEKNGEFMYCGRHHNATFDFDSLGMKTRGDRWSADTFCYTLLPGNVLLTCYIIRSSGIDTQRTYSCFDTTGRLVFSLKHLNGSFNNVDTTVYSYTTDGKLSCKKEMIYIQGQTDVPRKIVERYYYKGNLLDSATTTYFYINSNYDHTDMYYYDKDGLCHSALTRRYPQGSDSRNKALHVYYRYKKFGEG